MLFNIIFPIHLIITTLQLIRFTTQMLPDDHDISVILTFAALASSFVVITYLAFAVSNSLISEK